MKTLQSYGQENKQTYKQNWGDFEMSWEELDLKVYCFCRLTHQNSHLDAKKKCLLFVGICIYQKCSWRFLCLRFQNQRQWHLLHKFLCIVFTGFFGCGNKRTSEEQRVYLALFVFLETNMKISRDLQVSYFQCLFAVQLGFLVHPPVAIVRSKVKPQFPPIPQPEGMPSLTSSWWNKCINFMPWKH